MCRPLELPKAKALRSAPAGFGWGSRIAVVQYTVMLNEPGTFLRPHGDFYLCAVFFLEMMVYLRLYPVLSRFIDLFHIF